ncbi:MAG TPA: HDOD domain-containing protein [Gammaproteobacteria bacterium]
MTTKSPELISNIPDIRGPNQNDGSPLLDIKPRIEKIDKLPPMPEMTQKIIRLSADPNASVAALVKVVELDPSLAVQIMRYASSPFFGYQGKIDSVNTAIARVLGFSMVVNLALGVTAAKPFKIPRNVPLGLENFWRHAIFSAALVQALSGVLNDELRPPVGLAYLSGLLHNFGHLLLGHLFKQEFLILNKHIASEPETPIIDIEMKVIGTDHGQIGAWLMQAWKLPEEVIIATREHHNANYNGPHAVYPQLVMLADHLLKGQGIGDAHDSKIPASLLDALELGEYQVTMLTNLVLENNESLDRMAQQLAS